MPNDIQISTLRRSKIFTRKGVDRQLLQLCLRLARDYNFNKFRTLTTEKMSKKKTERTPLLEALLKRYNVLPFTCPVCDYKCARKSDMNKHERRHTGEKPYECEQCNKKFSQNTDLNKHLRIHTGIKPYKCPICGKPSSRKDYLDVHMRTHSNEKPYTCDICKKKYKQKSHLSIHMKTHSERERRFACDNCDNKYYVKHHLVKHMKVHETVPMMFVSVTIKSEPEGNDDSS